MEDPGKRTKEEVLELVTRQNVQFIRLWFTDVLGKLKNVAITTDQLKGAMEEGMGFDGSSIQGFARIEESDMVAFPDPGTFCLLPWRATEEGTVCRMFCDLRLPDGTPYAGDPRNAFRRQLQQAADMGYTFYVGPELEYYYFKSATEPEVLDHGGYFDMTHLDAARNLRRDTVLMLRTLGIAVEYSHHEVGPSQHEIDLRYTDGLTMADQCQTYRLVVKEVAANHGVYATFMPKPLQDQNGSGMHTHQSLFSGDRNQFHDANDEYHLSDTAKHYIAGILRHAPEICSVICQWVNSYKRLVVGYEAPVYICWARRNRSAMVRIPMYKPGKESATRIEFRAPDPACNPYLAFAVMLAAGLRGIKEKYPLPAPVEKDVYDMTERERAALDIGRLPPSLGDALVLTERSELVRETLGDHIFEAFIRSKRIEWERYRKHVHPYEMQEYLPVL